MENVGDRVVVEFKSANGSQIEVSAETLKKSEIWFEKLTSEEEVNTSLVHDESFDEAVSQDEKESSRNASASPSTSSDYKDLNTSVYEAPRTPIIFKDVAEHKPFTPSIITAKLNLRKRKAEEEDAAAAANKTPVPLGNSQKSNLTPEQRELIRRNREAALAKRRSTLGF